MTVRVQQEAFDAAREAEALTRGRTDVGALVTFSGIVRDTEGTLEAMQIEHYPGMTERSIAAMEAEAVDRWSLSGCLVIHRHGSLRPGEPIMMVATAAAHRSDAFAAAEFLMDYLKSRAPFWKKEITRSGESWVAARDADEQALKRW